MGAAMGRCVVKKHAMEFVSDPDTYKAVMLARWLVRTGKRGVPLATSIAARKYGVDVDEVRRLFSQVGGRAKRKATN